MLKRRLFFEDAREDAIDELLNVKPTKLVEMMTEEDPLVHGLEEGTPEYRVWIDALNDLNVNDVLSNDSVKSNFTLLKKYVRGVEDAPLEEGEVRVNILSYKETQELICDLARSFLRNIKQEFGNVLIAFSARLVSLFETLGRRNPARGVFYLVKNNSETICSSIVNAISEYTESKPSVVGLHVKRSGTKKGPSSKYSISYALIQELKNVFNEEVVINPEEAIILNDRNKQVVDITTAINISDLINVTQARDLRDDKGVCTIYSAFRMDKGGSSVNYVFGMQVVSISDTDFDILFYSYLADSISKPKGVLPCSDWT